MIPPRSWYLRRLTMYFGWAAFIAVTFILGTCIGFMLR